MNKDKLKGMVIGFILCAALSTAMVIAANAPSFRYARITYGIGVMLDGQMVNFPEESTPFVMENRTFLPLRALAELLGLNVDYDPETHTAILSSDASSTPATAHPILNNPNIPEIPFEVQFVIEAQVEGGLSALTLPEGLSSQTIVIREEWDGEHWYTIVPMGYLMFSNEPIRNEIDLTRTFGWGTGYALYTFPAGTQYVGLVLDGDGQPGWSLVSGLWAEGVSVSGNPTWGLDWDSLNDFSNLTIPEGRYHSPALRDIRINTRTINPNSPFGHRIGIAFRVE